MPGKAIERGFTLLELLVAITVFALMIGILVSGFRFGARVWEQAEQTSSQVIDVESAFALVRRLIAGALPYTVPTEDGEVYVDFLGTADAVSFVAPAPAQAFVGALHTISLLRLPAASASEGVRLILNVRPYAPNEEPPRPKKRRRSAEQLDKSVVLVERAAAVDFLYFGGTEVDPTPRWQTTWADRSTLPLLVAVRVRFGANDRRYWPDLLVAPVVLEAG